MGEFPMNALFTIAETVVALQAAGMSLVMLLLSVAIIASAVAEARR
ncbi:hypothetical protein [Microlunatus sp. Y2014]